MSAGAAKRENMGDLPQWVCWRAELREGKATKIPYSHKSGVRARSDDPATWDTLPEARKAARDGDVVFVGFGSHLFADMMTLGGVQLFWPRQAIAVFPGRDEYRVVTGSGSEALFVAVAFVLAALFYPGSRMGFDGLLYRLGGAEQVYGSVMKVTDGDTISVEVYGQIQPVRLIGVDTPETVALGQPVG